MTAPMTVDAELGEGNPTIVLKSRPKGEPTLANFATATPAQAALGSGSVRYRTKFLSVDPYLRGRMNEGKSYVPQFALGSPIVSGFVGEVVESQARHLQPGDLVMGGMGPWSRFGIADAEQVRKLPQEVSPSAFLGVLGMPGLTAYVGLLDIGKPQARETVVVSAASGAVGAVVVQLAKQRGCRVVGIAGGPEKCRYVVNELGADTCIDYRGENVREALQRDCPNGINIYFENVGGPVFEAVLANLADQARIPLCGMISNYNDEKANPGPNLAPLLVHKALLQGFIVLEHFDRTEAFLDEMVPLVTSGKMRYREDIVEGLENAPQALIGLLRGENFGKRLVKVS